jgi:hypothetical protein
VVPAQIVSETVDWVWRLRWQCGQPHGQLQSRGC